MSNTILNEQLYQPGDKTHWTGRVDGEDVSQLRWHQVVQCVDLNHTTDLSNTVVFLGFCCDEGVRRNQGRVGAKEAPAVYRTVLSVLPVHFGSHLKVMDAGNVLCVGNDLETAQQTLSDAVSSIVAKGGFPLLLGGGHEITYGHFNGLKKDNTKSIGIINLDAHLDIRPTQDYQGNSGTGFYQIAEDLEKENCPLEYLAIGIQQISNTKSLFDFADQKKVNIIYNTDIHTENMQHILDSISAFSKRVESIYLTIDLDVFAAAYAPGVSALAFNGITPDRTFYSILEHISRLPNLISVDLAELNPMYDIDNRTAKLGADLIFKIVQNLANFK